MEAQKMAEVFGDYLEKRGLIIVPKTVLEARQVNGIPLEEYRYRIMQRPWLSAKEISDAKLWGDIGKHAVKHIIKKEVPQEEIVFFNGTKKIPRGIVRNIAIARGCATG